VIFQSWLKSDGRRGWPAWFFAALLGYSTFLFMPQVLNDGDTYLHLAVGEWILKQGMVPNVDPFSYTFAGKPYLAHEWLSQVVMAFVFRLGGWAGLVILFGGVFALTLGMLARHLARWLNPLPAAITFLVVVACMSPTLLTRPHVLVLPFLEMWTAGLLIARDRKQSPSWFLLIIMLIWANLHGSFMFGLLLIAPFALEATLAARTEWRKVAASWGLFTIAAIASALVTPHGWQGLLFPLRLMNQKQLGSISEWQSMDFSTLQPIEIGLAAVLYMYIFRGVRIPALRLIVLGGVLYFAVQHQRQEMLAGLVGGLLVAGPLGNALGTLPVVARAREKGLAFRRISGLLVLMSLLTGLRIAEPIQRTDGPTWPVSALDHVPADLAAKPVLNEVYFGAYLIFRGVHPYVDGRLDMYGDGFMAEYLEMMRPDRIRLEQVLKTRDIRWAIFRAPSPINAIMDTLPGWERLYADNIAIVYIKTAK
jgi:hypothetical protein